MDHSGCSNLFPLTVDEVFLHSFTTHMPPLPHTPHTPPLPCPTCTFTHHTFCHPSPPPAHHTCLPHPSHLLCPPSLQENSMKRKRKKEGGWHRQTATLAKKRKKEEKKRTITEERHYLPPDGTDRTARLAAAPAPFRNCNTTLYTPAFYTLRATRPAYFMFAATGPLLPRSPHTPTLPAPHISAAVDPYLMDTNYLTFVEPTTPCGRLFTLWSTPPPTDSLQFLPLTRLDVRSIIGRGSPPFTLLWLGQTLLTTPHRTAFCPRYLLGFPRRLDCADVMLTSVI